MGKIKNICTATMNGTVFEGTGITKEEYDKIPSGAPKEKNEDE